VPRGWPRPRPSGWERPDRAPWARSWTGHLPIGGHRRDRDADLW